MKLPEDLTGAEQKLLDAVAKGEALDCRTGDQAVDDPAFGASWNDSRSIRAGVIRALCVGGEGIPSPDPRGISISGVQIEGDLDLESVKVAVPLRLTECHFKGRINCRNAEITLLDLGNSFLASGLDGSGATFNNLFLRDRFVCKEGAHLIRAKVSGFLDCSGATFDNPTGDALLADYMSVEGPVYLKAWVDDSGNALLAPFTAKGAVRLFSAKISGLLDCTGAMFDNPATEASPAKIALDAEGASIKGPVFLTSLVTPAGEPLASFIARGQVRLVGTEIGGNLACVGATFENGNGIALEAEAASVHGAVLLRPYVVHDRVACDFRSEGEIRLFHARIGTALDCDGARLLNPSTPEEPNRFALNAEGISVGASVYLRPAMAGGKVLRRFTAEGEVRLFRAQIGHTLECIGTFKNPGRTAINAEAVSVKGPVLLQSLVNANGELLATFTAEGTVSLFGAEIGGSLECGGATFEGADGVALQAEAASVKGVVLLRILVVDDRYVCPFSAKGEVRLAHTKMGSGLDCSGGEFKADQNSLSLVALNLSGAAVSGPVYLRSWSTDDDTLLFSAEGRVAVFGARIDGELDCRGARFAEFVNLEGASVHALRDDEDSWPEQGRLELDGFAYQRFSGASSASAGSRLEWLHRQHGYRIHLFDRLLAALRRWTRIGATRLRRKLGIRPRPAFRMQPYEQLIRVLRAEGREEDARKIASAKQSDLRKSGQLSLSGRLWNLMLGVLVGHGYRPGRTLWIAIAVVALGVLVFANAEDSCAIGPAKVDQVANPSRQPCWVLPSDYPKFNPAMYSLDVFLPIINLHQEDYWLPNGAPPTGWLARPAELGSQAGIPAGSLYWIYMWLHIALGWILTSFIVAALSGLIKKD
jgi:hypothetical protein